MPREYSELFKEFLGQSYFSQLINGKKFNFEKKDQLQKAKKL